MKIIYKYKCSYTGLEYRVKIDNVHTITDEPYPPLPLDALRVMRNASGQIIAGPLVSELIEWNEYK